MRRAQRSIVGALAFASAGVVSAGCGGPSTAPPMPPDAPTTPSSPVANLASSSSSSTAPAASPSGPPAVRAAPSQASALTPGDMLASRALQGAPFFLIHDDTRPFDCRRWAFAEGQLVGDEVHAKMREVREPRAASRELRVDAAASVAIIVRVGGAQTWRYSVSSERDGLALWADGDRRDRYMLFFTLEACRGGAHREESGGSRAADGGSREVPPRDRVGPPGTP